VTPENSSVYLDRKLAYALFRLSLGTNVLMHGAARIFGPRAEAFASKTASLFSGTPLPPGPVHAFLVVLPFVEFTLGGLIAAGLFTLWALTLGSLLIVSLIFGTALRSDWPTIGIQMIYSITYYFLLLHRADNGFSLDTLFGRFPQPGLAHRADQAPTTTR
jgi:thiosulfate dehydrogenase [quinone] large subunit